MHLCPRTTRTRRKKQDKRRRNCRVSPTFTQKGATSPGARRLENLRNGRLESLHYRLRSERSGLGSFRCRLLNAVLMAMLVIGAAAAKGQTTNGIFADFTTSLGNFTCQLE